MDFKDFWFKELAPADRDAFAAKANTSRGLLNQVAYRNKQIELGFADVISALSGRRVSLDDLPLTDNARRQRVLREPLTAPNPDTPDRGVSRLVGQGV